jgi:hypothetical protein
MEIVRIKCDECGRVTVIEVGTDCPAYEANPGEFIEYRCGACEEVTAHLVVPVAEEPEAEVEAEAA